MKAWVCLRFLRFTAHSPIHSPTLLLVAGQAFSPLRGCCLCLRQPPHLEHRDLRYCAFKALVTSPCLKACLPRALATLLLRPVRARMVHRTFLLPRMRSACGWILGFSCFHLASQQPGKFLCAVHWRPPRRWCGRVLVLPHYRQGRMSTACKNSGLFSHRLPEQYRMASFAVAFGTGGAVDADETFVRSRVSPRSTPAVI
jgi:hypothetical protein